MSLHSLLPIKAIGIEWILMGQFNEETEPEYIRVFLRSLDTSLYIKESQKTETERNQETNVLATTMGFGFSRSLVSLPKSILKRKVSATNMQLQNQVSFPPPDLIPPSSSCTVKQVTQATHIIVHVHKILLFVSIGNEQGTKNGES